MAEDGRVVIGRKAKVSKGLPLRTGMRYSGRTKGGIRFTGAKHGAGSNRIPGKKRHRSKLPPYIGVAVCVSGVWVELSQRRTVKVVR